MCSASNPFEGMPFFGDLMKMLGAQGPVQWDGARQLALSIATDGGAEPNVDPLERITYEQLSRVAELHVANATGLEVSLTGVVSITPVTRGQWVHLTLQAYRPLIERLATSLQADADTGAPGDLGDPGDPGAGSIGPGAGAGDLPGFPGLEGDPDAFLAKMMGFLTPMLVGMTAGSLGGPLATRPFGLYALPIPRPDREEIAVVAANVAAFGEEWSMDGTDLRLWVCLNQATRQAVLRAPHVRERMEDLLGEYVGSFESDPGAFGDALGDVDADELGGDPMAGFQHLVGNPEFVLGAVQSERQLALRAEIESLVSVVEGYVDHVMDRLGHGLIGSYRQITEAMQRRRVEASESDRFVERLLGIELTRPMLERGRAFVDGGGERAGDDVLRRLWLEYELLPTPSEVAAPGLWLARIGVDTFDADLEIDLSGLEELLGGDEPGGSEEPGSGEPDGDRGDGDG